MPNEDIVAHLWAKLRTVSAFNEAYSVLQDLNVDSVNRDIKPDDFRNLQRVTLELLKRLTIDEVNLGRWVILEFLLPACLEPVDESDFTARLEARRFRELLRDWIEQYKEIEKLALRNEILTILCEILEKHVSKEPIWTIEEVGYRLVRIEEILWKLIEREDDVGDAALETIVSLGVPLAIRNRVLGAVHQRAAFRPLKSLLYVIQELADPLFVKLIRDKIDRSSDKEERQLHVLALLGQIASTSPEDIALQDAIWSEILILARREAETARGELYLSGGAAPRCNTPAVVPDFLHLILEDSDPPEATGPRRRLAYLRLEDCGRPRQILGWKDQRNGEALPLLKRDVLDPSVEEELKTHAWKILLSLHTEEPLKWIDEAVSTEKNDRVTREFLETASVFHFKSLPSVAIRLITERRNITRGESAPDLFARIAAVQFARNAATPEAFTALLNFGLTYQDHAPRDNAEALAEVALSLAKRGAHDVVQELFERASTGNQISQRTAALSAIRRLAAEGVVGADMFERMQSLATDEGLPAYARGLAIGAIGFLPNGHEEAFRFLRRVAQEDEENANYAIEAIVRQGKWVQIADQIAKSLHLIEEGAAWTIQKPSERTAWEAAILGLLFSSDRAAFGPAVRELIVEGQSDAVYHVLHHSVSSHDDAFESREVADALVARISSVYARLVAETWLFSFLCRISPERIISEPWEDKWTSWLPDSRASLADTLGRMEKTHAIAKQDRLTSLLRELMTDGIYAVRRSATRALREINLRALTGACIAWSKSERSDLRMRAAEAIAWLPEIEQEQFSLLYEQLSTDREPLVRPVATRSKAERFKRKWADDYFEKVTALTGKNGNSEILEAFNYGRALGLFGEDQHSRKLQLHATNADLPPNLKYWMLGIAKTIDDRWQKVTREWPQPWLSWDGTIEEIDGSVLSKTHEIAVHFSLWRKMHEDPNRHPEWGGALWSTKGESLLEFFDLDMRIPGRRNAYGHITHQSSSGLVVFQGSGAYPDRQQ